MTKSLGEKWLKLCDDFISDEVVCIGQELINGCTPSWPVFVEGYASGNFGLEVRFRVICGHGNFHNYRVVLQSPTRANTARPGTMKFPDTQFPVVNPLNMKGCLMFVLIRQPVENIYRMLFPRIPSTVRIEGLQMTDQINCPCWKFGKDSLIVPNPSIEGFPVRLGEGNGFAHIDRELNPARSGLSRDPRQPKDQIIQNRAQFADASGHRITQSGGDFAVDNKPEANYLIGSFRLLLGDYAIRFGVKESPTFKFEILDISPSRTCLNTFNHH